MIEASPEVVVEIAEEMHKMADTNGWKILMRILKTEAENAKDRLVDADPNDIKAVQKAQNLVHRYQWFETSVSELMSAANMAEFIKENQMDIGEFYD